MFDKFITEGDREIVDTVARALQETLPTDRLSRSDGGLSNETAFWPEILALGWLGVNLPTDIGGTQAGNWIEIGMFREFGRQLLSPRALATTVAAAVAIEARQPRLAGEILLGKQATALAVQTARGRTGIIGKGDLVLNVGETGLTLHRTGSSVTSPAWAFDDTLPITVADWGDDAPLAGVPRDSAARLRLLRLVAAMQTGIAEATLTMARDHAATRQQFGKPIGAFQAVKHMCADMAVRAASAGALLGSAAEDGAGSVECAAAALTATAAARDNASAAIQIFGGMGFTAECPVQLYLKRATLLEIVVGGQDELQDDILVE
jgi:alkylation response protein AidB-like acyl-CoA dehydrogenase